MAMVEDTALNAFLKQSLEDENGLSAQRLHALEQLAAQAVTQRRWRRRLLMWSAPAAAGLLACLAFAHLVVTPRPTSSRHGVVEVIELLAAAEGMATGEDLLVSSPADALLAWQEAPCADLL